MAQRLEMSEVEDLIPYRRIPIKDRYPWDEWIDGNHWLLKRGVDYFVKDATFENTVYRLKPHIGRVKLHKIPDGYILIALEAALGAGE